MLLLATDLNGHLRVHPKRLAFLPDPAPPAPSPLGRGGSIRGPGGGAWDSLLHTQFNADLVTSFGLAQLTLWFALLALCSKASFGFHCLVH